MVGILQPLDKNVKIINEDGTPNLYFIKWAQQRQIDIGDSITLADLEDYLTSHQLQAGTAIVITPDGDISNSPTITHDDSAVTPGTYGDATHVPQLTVDQQGHITGVTDVAISGGGGGGGWTLISSVTTASSASSVTFSSISGSYTHLQIIYTCASDASGTSHDLDMILNSDTGNNYAWARFITNGAGASGGAGAAATSDINVGRIPGTTAPANEAGKGRILFHDYADTTFNKGGHHWNTHRIGTGANGQNNGDGSFSWYNTSAITQIDITPSSGNFVDGSKFYLYGLS